MTFIGVAGRFGADDSLDEAFARDVFDDIVVLLLVVDVEGVVLVFGLALVVVVLVLLLLPLALTLPEQAAIRRDNNAIQSIAGNFTFFFVAICIEYDPPQAG